MEKIDQKHEPQKLEGRPDFLITGSDVLGDDHAAYWAAIREGDFGLADAIHERLKDRRRKIPNRLSDKEHARGARERANQMRAWYAANLGAGSQPPAKVSEEAAAGDLQRQIEERCARDKAYAGQFSEDARLAEIRNAHPPAEPDEAM